MLAVPLEPDDSQTWGPRSVNDWRSVDPLNPAGHPWTETQAPLYNPTVEFNAWQRLPDPLRAQAFREREIQAALRLLCYDLHWDERPELRRLQTMGVGIRPWEQAGIPGLRLVAQAIQGVFGEFSAYWKALNSGNIHKINDEYSRLKPEAKEHLNRAALAMVLTFIPPVPSIEELHLLTRLDPVMSIDSEVIPLADYGLPVLVPVVFEASRDYRPLNSPVSQVSGAGAALRVLQSGQEIIGSPNGIRSLGTLHALVDYDRNIQRHHGLIGPRHVLGTQGDVYQGIDKIAKINFASRESDFALAELEDQYTCKREILSRNLDPAAPIPPVNGMPAEYWGVSTQKTVESFVSQVYIETPSFYNVGNAPHFEMDGDNAGGDSGAMILSGHNQQDVTSRYIARYAPGLSASQLSAILGMLVNGVSAQMNGFRLASILATSAVTMESILTNNGYIVHWLAR